MFRNKRGDETLMSEKPARPPRDSPRSPQLRKAPVHSSKDPEPPKVNKYSNGKGVPTHGAAWADLENVKERSQSVRYLEETSLAAQGLRLWAPSTGALRSIPGQGTRSHVAQLRHGTAKYINK